MSNDLGHSLSDEATFAGAKPKRPLDDVSLGDERTLGGGDAAGLDTLIDDIEVVDLESRYRIEGTLGQGGMGAVLLATDTRLGRKVAIKRILGEAAGNRMAVHRFLTEAKAIAALNHQNIVQIYDYGRAKDGPFLIMEFVDGGSLADRCKQGALPLDEAVELACQLCDGLAKAHDAGIVHRDIKPANVLLNRDGVPKLTDFGLAKAEASDHGMTMTGAVMGTPDFMPLEQRRDASLVDARSDLWSLAASVYQMVTGRSPKIIRFDLLPGELTNVLGKALEDEKDARYQSARELRDALRTSMRAAASAVEELVEGACPACGVKNESSRRFCRGCGDSLEAPCLSCTKPLPMWEEICGSCGAKQTPLLDKRRQAMAARQAEAEGLLGDFEFDRAVAVAEALRAESHRKLQHLSGWAKTFLEQVERSRADQTSHACEVLAEASKHESAYDYGSGITALEAIPSSLRGILLPGAAEPAAVALERLSGKVADVRRLESVLKQRLEARSLDGLLPDVEKLLALRPDRQDVQRLRAQLIDRQKRQATARSEAVANARSRMEGHDYEGAVGILSALEGPVRSAEVESLQERATALVGQLHSLSTRIRDAVRAKAFDGLLEPVEEFLRLRPTDTEMTRLRQSLVEREQKYARDIDGRLAQARELERACKFEKAAELLDTIPVPRRSAEVTGLLERCAHLGWEQKGVLKVLTRVGAGGYEDAVSMSRGYAAALAEMGLSDPEFTKLFANAQAALKNEVRKRKLLVTGGLVMTGLAVAVLLITGGIWVRSTMRSAAVASALARSRWDDALAIDANNVTALIGRARAKFEATPADIPGAFADLERAEATGRGSAAVKSARAETFVARARERAAAGDLAEAAVDLAEVERFGGDDELISRVREAYAAGWLRSAEAAVAKESVPAMQAACREAVRYGAPGDAIWPLWLRLGEACLERYDQACLGMAVDECLQHGLSEAKAQDLWLRFAAVAVSKGDASAISLAIRRARLLGAAADVVDPMRARLLIVEATDYEKAGNREQALSKMWEALLVDGQLAKASLMQPASLALRQALVAESQSTFEVALADQKWDYLAQVISVAQTLDDASPQWMAASITALPRAVVASIPAEIFGSLPPAVLNSLPPTVIVAQPPVRNSIGLELKLISAGTFTMGQAGGGSDETPHRVTLTKTYYIGVYEVTNAQWQRVMGNVPSRWKDADRPVEEVSWEDANEFCRRLSALPEEQQAGRIYRLPTEAEWEYACRAGTSTKYSFGDDESQLGEHAWFDGNSGNETHPVGKKKPNPWGLYDMHGNVWEWCSDWYGDYENGGTTDPQGPSGGSLRALRGGSWFDAAGSCRSALRYGLEPSYRNVYLGCRLALDFQNNQRAPGPLAGGSFTPRNGPSDSKRRDTETSPQPAETQLVGNWLAVAAGSRGSVVPKNRDEMLPLFLRADGTVEYMGTKLTWVISAPDHLRIGEETLGFRIEGDLLILTLGSGDEAHFKRMPNY